ncbi:MULTISPECIES: hypothetical protein [Cysteiniphilum]|uniref:hypothetical protein n=1 Tax=Cysteiniphilum TaxID=2056696 RepID=UPI00178504E1|nr:MULTISPECIES: hypothetical protein [Cysteiniphilum]
MKFEEPKSKTGKPMLGVIIAYYSTQSPKKRWYLNGELATTDKIALVLEYRDKFELLRATSKYGVPLVMTKGLDKIRESNNGS